MENLLRTKRIHDALTAALTPSYLEIRDDSANHAGHSGNPGGAEGTHIHIVIAAGGLKGLSRIAAHQKIYGLLANEFASGLHALSLEIRPE